MNVDGFDASSVGEGGAHLPLGERHGGLSVGGFNGELDVQVDEDGDLILAHAADDDSRPPEVNGAYRTPAHIDGAE